MSPDHLVKKKELGAGQKAALLLSSHGSCQRPDCSELLVVERDSVPIINFEYAHIYDELPPNNPDSDQGWRYYLTDLSQEERNHHANVLLLCEPCHKLIDKIKPKEYPPDLLDSWKRQAEASGELSISATLDQANLEELQRIIVSLSPASFSFPFIDYGIEQEELQKPAAQARVTPILQICGTSPLLDVRYRISIASGYTNPMFNPECTTSAGQQTFGPGSDYWINRFSLEKCWQGTDSTVVLHATITTRAGTFSQNTHMQVIRDRHHLVTLHSIVDFSDGSAQGTKMIYTRCHDNLGKPNLEEIFGDKWASGAPKPLYRFAQKKV